jgi:predicted MFS family arabinose efflux permease
MWHLGATYTAYGFSYIIFMTYFTKRLVSDIGYTEAHAGTLFMVMGWCSLLSGVLWGGISDRMGRKWTLAVVYCAHCVAFTLFALWPSTSGVILATVLFGFTAWSVPVIMAAASDDVLGPRLCPAGLGFITVFLGLGQAVGPSVAGALADAAGGFAVAFLVAAAAAALGVVGSLTLSTARIQSEACQIPQIEYTSD